MANYPAKEKKVIKENICIIIVNYYGGIIKALSQENRKATLMPKPKRKCKHDKIILIERRHFCIKCHKDFHWQNTTIPQGHKNYEIELKEFI